MAGLAVVVVVVVVVVDGVVEGSLDLNLAGIRLPADVDWAAGRV